MGLYRRLKESAVPTVPVSDPALRIFVPPRFYNGPRLHDGPETVRPLPPHLLCEHNYCSSESIDSSPSRPVDIESGAPLETKSHSSSDPFEYLAVPSTSTATMAAPQTSSSGPFEYLAVPSTSTTTMAAPQTCESVHLPFNSMYLSVLVSLQLCLMVGCSLHF
ncbi:uncharacterized protein LOC144163277 [Haemaphysalis longicornis]